MNLRTNSFGFGISFDVRRSMFDGRCPPRRRASILVGLLWCVALLSLVVVGTLHTSRIDLMAVKNYGDRIQAHYLALAGIEKAKALLYQNAHDRSRSAKNHSGELYNAPEQFRDVSFGRGKFRVFRRGRQDEGGGVIYGITDEESRLNVNYATAEQLTNITQMTTDIASAILEWRGGGSGGSTVNPGGANADYYLSLQPPYQPRHGPLQTVRELLLVRGITRDLLFGKDKHQNGLLPAAGDGEDDSLSVDALSSDTDAGWAALLTVASTENNMNAGGQDRVNVQSADESALTGVKGITSQIARAIISYRGQNQFQSIADLLDVTSSQNQTQNQNQNSGSGASFGQRSSNQSQSSGQNSSGPSSSSSNPGGSGSKVISQDLFLQLADDVTTADGQSLAGMININTAGLDVLMCLPGVDRQLAQAIISYRQSSGFFANTAELLKVGGMTTTLFKQIAPRVTARSETFRILSEGKVTSTGARQRIQEIVHIGLNEISTLGYREDDL
jgi:competence ComEA-like helix-hairpin-helix protein